MAAVAPLQPAMTVIQLQVPPEAQPGAVVAAQVNGQTIQAQVPPGLQPGDIFSVQVPASAPPAGDPTAAYDTLLANTTRLTLTQPLVSPFPCEGLLFEADNGDKFRVKFDAPGRWIPLLDGYGTGAITPRSLSATAASSRRSVRPALFPATYAALIISLQLVLAADNDTARGLRPRSPSTAAKR